MCRHESPTLGGSGQVRPYIALLGGAVIIFACGCVPAAQGSAGDPPTTAAGAAISQFLGFISDFARQLLAAYLF